MEQGGGQRPNVKEVDKLFESLDEDGGGALDVTEVRGMLRKLKEAASDRLRESGEVKEAAAMYRARAGQAKDVANATRASEQADKRLDELKGKKSLDARLGEVLVQKAVKIGEIVNKWGGHPDDGGDGQVSKEEFRAGVLAIGCQAEVHEMDDLFNRLDKDHGGTLDVAEVRSAFMNLRDSYNNREEEVGKLTKQMMDLQTKAKAAQADLKQQQKADDQLAAERRQVLEEQAMAKRAAHEEERAARRAIRAEKRAVAARERAEFDRKVIELRRAHQAEVNEVYFSSFEDVIRAMGSRGSDKSDTGGKGKGGAALPPEQPKRRRRKEEEKAFE